MTFEKLLTLLANYPPSLPVEYDIAHQLYLWPSAVQDYPRGGLHLVPGSMPATCASLGDLLRTWRPGDERRPSAPVWADADDDMEPAQAIIGWQRTPTALVLIRASIADYLPA